MNSIFWSWQSDLNPRVTRNVIREALAKAIDDLHAELDERTELTSDTKGVAGSPDIVATILEKIDAAAVFVGDVTPIAVAASGKAIANPNVLIELGYAKKAIGLNRIVQVWNTAFEGAELERLPFDMRGRRAPISFHLSPEATKQQLAAAREVLAGMLLEALRASLAIANPPVPPPVVEWQATSGNSPALWFDPAKPLPINEDGVAGAKAMSPGPYAYARILPTAWSRPSNFGQENHAYILGDTRGFSWGTTKAGFLTYTGSLRSPAQSNLLTNMTMQFRATGELWGVDPHIAARDGRNLFFADHVIKGFNDFLDASLPYLQAQGARAPFRVRLGVTDLEGLRWVTDTGWGGTPQALEPSVEASFTLSGTSEEERLAALEVGWGEIANAFGVSQPNRATLVKQIRGF